MEPRRSLWSRSGALLFALLALLAPFSRGGVDLWVEGTATGLALVALVASSASQTKIPASAIALIGVVGVSVLQLVPLPPVFHRLSPAALRVFEVSLAPLGLYPALRPLSLDPASSARELAKAIGCTAAFVGAWRYSGTRRRRDRVLLALALSSVSASVLVFGSALLGIGSLLAPRFPFVNPNHLAGFLNLTSFVALGLASRTRGQARALWGMAFVSGAAVVFLSLSRAGIGAFFVGSAVFVAVHLGRYRSAEAIHPVRQAAIAGIVATAVGAAAFLALDPILAELRTLGESRNDVKVRLLAPAFELFSDTPFVGIGPGAFPVVFSGYQSESSDLSFTHLENEWLQPIVDLGLPGGLLLVGTFAWIWVSAVRRRGVTESNTGLLAGTAALAANNAFDFSLGILGVALPFALAMGLLARDQRPVSPARWLARLGLAASALACCAALAIAANHELDHDRDWVEQAVGAHASARAAREALRWHPADWVAHAVVGVRAATEQGCRDAIPWLQRAMILGPGAPGPHLAAARCLVGRNDVAAKREYRLAIVYGEPALEDAMQRYPALQDLLEIAPITPDGLFTLGTVLATAKRPADAYAVFERLHDEFSDERATLPMAFARAALRDDIAALDLARRASATRPADPEPWLLAANCLLRLGREDEAGSEVGRGLAAVPGSPLLLGFLAERAMVVRRWSEAKRLAEQIAPRTPIEIADKYLLVARALAGQGRISEALETARSAAAVTPEALGPVLTVAQYSAQAGRFEDAIAALRHAGSLPGAPSDGYARRIDDLEELEKAARQGSLLRDAFPGSPP